MAILNKLHDEGVIIEICLPGALCSSVLVLTCKSIPDENRMFPCVL